MGGVGRRDRTFSALIVVVLVVVVSGGGGGSATDDSELLFLQELGISAKPELFKANISQEEYVDKMQLYLSRRMRLEGSTQPNEETPQLVSYDSERKSWKRKFVGGEETLQYRIHIRPTTTTTMMIQSAELRMLLPPQAHAQPLALDVYGASSRLRMRTLLSTRRVHVSDTQPKWADFDVSAAFGDGRMSRIDLTLTCENCLIDTLRPLQTHLNLLLLLQPARRKKRSYFDMGRPTDCVNVNVPLRKDRKPNCCRHDMHVSFAALHMDYIIQPKQYEAGFCRGRCPYHFNHATNHSRIQSLVHRQDKRAIPRSCCAPSRLDPLEILMVDPHDPSKLMVEQWNDMIVSECLCA